ncbi:hypothetical protein VNO77_02988 [Canavalia gladiata]|uniref:Uncharacterized protein n=1 Tax=Canavalia gladiata TaxID=3824 RepID=A0AAN9MZ60_CANGL
MAKISTMLSLFNSIRSRIYPVYEGCNISLGTLVDRTGFALKDRGYSSLRHHISFSKSCKNGMPDQTNGASAQQLSTISVGLEFPVFGEILAASL